MGRLLKYLFWALLAMLIGLVSYALVSELPAPTEERTVPLPLPAPAPAPAAPEPAAPEPAETDG
ncbi:MAG: hypothetical protein ACFBRM_04495 [Pikeienuella sp.]